RVVANVFLVCEGPADGLDQRLLDVLVIQKHQPDIAAWLAPAPAGDPDRRFRLAPAPRVPLAGEPCGRRFLRRIAAADQCRGEPQLWPTPPATPAGAVAPGQADWLPVLQSEAARVCRDCLALGGLAELQPTGSARRL